MLRSIGIIGQEYYVQWPSKMEYKIYIKNRIESNKLELSASKKSPWQNFRIYRSTRNIQHHGGSDSEDQFMPWKWNQ